MGYGSVREDMGSSLQSRVSFSRSLKARFLPDQIVLGLDLTALDWTFCRCISCAEVFLALLGLGLTILGLNGLAYFGAAVVDLAR